MIFNSKISPKFCNVIWFHPTHVSSISLPRFKNRKHTIQWIKTTSNHSSLKVWTKKLPVCKGKHGTNILRDYPWHIYWCKNQPKWWMHYLLSLLSKIFTSSTKFSELKWGIKPKLPKSCAIFLLTRASFSCWKCSMSPWVTLKGTWSPSTKLSSNLSNCCSACWELAAPCRFTWTSFGGGLWMSFSFLIGFGSSFRMNANQFKTVYELILYNPPPSPYRLTLW